MTLATQNKPLNLPAEFNIEQAAAEAEMIVARYAGWARTLMRVVEAKQLFAIINGKKYLEFEAWQIIGTFDRATADTDNVEPIVTNGEINGYICHAKILKDGVKIGGAMQMCGLDAFPCRGKEGSAKNNAAISAAQTWAGSKAFRMLYSAVAVLGGYGAATAEEMRRSEEEAQDKTQHWCTTHQTNWFMRGKMNHYAHPIEGTNPVQWCNEPKPQPDNADPAAPQSAPAITYEQLRAEVEASNMTWAEFEIQVLGKTWAAFSKVKGASAQVAKAMWETWKDKQAKEG